jgi:hypothetical protein
MEFTKQFKKDYQQWFREMSSKQLIAYEQNLSLYIDSELYENSILADEVEILYELIRDECVYRVLKFAETDLNI